MYYAPERTRSNKIIVYLSPTQPIPTVPSEIASQVTPDKWEARIHAINSVAARYSKPMFERVWLGFGIIAMLVVPFAIHRFVLYDMFHERPGQMMGVSWITFAIFVALGILFIGPLAIWKYIGNKHVNMLTQQWLQADRALFGQNSTIWTVQTTRVFNNRFTLTVTLPPSLMPTMFHPNAYLPSYINGPNDVDAIYYYPFKAEAGLPRMSVVGNVPIYNDEKRGFVDYSKV